MNFSEILTNCRSGNGDVRNKAERDIDNMAMNDFGVLLEQCSAHMADDDAIKENRQMCATLIKNMILYQEKHSGKWENLPFEQKVRIKNNVLSCLASKVKEVRKAAAVTISGKRGEY